MGVQGQLCGQTVALEKVLRNIVKMFMEEKLTYKPIRTLTVERDLSIDIERLRIARKSSRIEVTPIALLDICSPELQRTSFSICIEPLVRACPTGQNPEARSSRTRSDSDMLPCRVTASLTPNPIAFG